MQLFGKLEKNQRLPIFAVLAAGAAFALFKYGKNVFYVTLPFIVARLTAQLLHKPCEFLNKKLHIKKTFAAVIVVLLFYVIIWALLLLLFSGVIQEAVGFSESLLRFSEQMKLKIIILNKQLNDRFPSISFLLYDGFDFGSLTEAFCTQLASKAASCIKGFALVVPRLLVGIGVKFLATCFFTADFGGTTDFLLYQLPEKRKAFICECRKQAYFVYGSYLRAYGMIAIITFCELFIGLLPIVHSHAAPIAVIITLVDILPVFGAGTVLLPWALFEQICGNATKAIELLILYAFVTVIRQWIEPRIVGSYMGVSPLVALACMYFGGKLLGVVGIFVLPMIAVVLKNLNERGTIHLYSAPPEKLEQAVRRSGSRYRKIRRQDKKQGQDKD